MPQQPNIADSEDADLRVTLPESARRFIKVEAARNDVSMGEYIVELLTQYAGYDPAADR